MLGIYKITNKKTEKFYIGRSKDVFERMRAHYQLLKKGKHGNKKFQEEMNGCSLGDLTFEILETCSISKAKAQEEFWIKELKAIELGYNVIEKDEELTGYKITVDQTLVPFLKKAFTNANPEIPEPTINILEEDTFEFLLKLFSNDMDLIRPRGEIFVLPDKFKKYRKPPFIYVREDFGLI